MGDHRRPDWLALACAAALGAVAGLLSVSAGNAGESMITGSVTSQPIGHFEFCKKNPEVCAVRSADTRPEVLTDALWAKVAALNAKVNRAIKPMSDYDIYGKDEVWAFPAGVGDCEDYVLEKQRELEAAGLPPTALLITVVRKRDGEGHAVLTLRTDRGDYILDNLTDDIREWDKTSYRFLKRQDDADTGRWVAIREGAATMVGALN